MRVSVRCPHSSQFGFVRSNWRSINDSGSPISPSGWSGPLQPGDTLTLQLAADEFRRCSSTQGGRTESRGRVVDRVPYGARSGRAASAKRRAPELMQLHTRNNARPGRRFSRRSNNSGKTGNLRPEDREAIAKAEQPNSAFATKIDAPDEGIRALLEKQRQAVRDNRLPRIRHDRSPRRRRHRC